MLHASKVSTTNAARGGSEKSLSSVDARVGSPNVQASLAPTCATQGTKVCETRKDESVITMVSEWLGPQGVLEMWQRKARQSLSNAPSASPAGAALVVFFTSRQQDQNGGAPLSDA